MLSNAWHLNKNTMMARTGKKENVFRGTDILFRNNSQKRKLIAKFTNIKKNFESFEKSLPKRKNI